MPFKNPHPLYSCWCDMKSRCNNPNNKAYSNYGGRGISVCEEWANNFKAFANFMGERPPGMTLDRIDNNKDYSPDNCKWSTRKEQQRNQTVTRKLTINGEIYVAADLADIAGIKTDTIIERFERGLPYEQIVSTSKLHNFSGLALGGVANGVRQRSKTHCPHGHKYTKQNTRYYKGYRSCKKCNAIREQNRRNKLKDHT